ncbi:MAG: hypothetical protein CSA38_00120 [Flavobacteriales bacterium]|nr:MAG: hypothetical protein CSA38_00120 [Flavobacteriales bacterium]
MKKIPNLFDYATSELSQDAFLTWLIHWSDKDFEKQDKVLNACAIDFVQQLLGKDENFTIESIKVGRQWKNIDVWALVNDTYFLIIEDKKGTKEHSNQLSRYAEVAKEYYQNSDIEVKLVYFKMEEQSSYNEVEKANYFSFTRAKMLTLLERYINDIENNIVLDYYQNLKSLDQSLKAYLSLPLEKWEWYQWQGFYTEIQKTLGTGDWDYVANKSGGFLGFWWHWKTGSFNGTKFQYYLQLEQDKLVFKLYVEEESNRREVRDFYAHRLLEKAKELNIELTQFGRLGKYMSIAKLNTEYRIINEKGLLDFSLTIENLKKIMNLLDKLEIS